MSEDSTTEKPRAAWLNVLIGVVIGLALGMTVAASAAVKLYWDATGLMEVKVAQFESDAAALQAQITERDATIATLEARTAGLRGRVALARAIASLDARNFGIAQTELVQAKELLGAASPEVQAAAQSLAALDVRIGDDAGLQRAQMVAAGAQLDTALGN